MFYLIHLLTLAQSLPTQSWNIPYPASFSSNSTLAQLDSIVDYTFSWHDMTSGALEINLDQFQYTDQLFILWRFIIDEPLYEKPFISQPKTPCRGYRCLTDWPENAS